MTTLQRRVIVTLGVALYLVYLTFVSWPWMADAISWWIDFSGIFAG